MATQLGYRVVEIPPRWPGDVIDYYADVTPYQGWGGKDVVVTEPGTDASDAGGILVCKDYMFAAWPALWAGLWRIDEGPPLSRVRVLLCQFDDSDIIETIETTKGIAGCTSRFRTQPTTEGGIWTATGDANYPWSTAVDGTAWLVSDLEVGDELAHADAGVLVNRTGVDAALATYAWT